METHLTFDTLQDITKYAEDSLEKAVTSAEAYDMRESDAVNLALQEFFSKLSYKLGKQSILTYLKA